MKQATRRRLPAGQYVSHCQAVLLLGWTTYHLVKPKAYQPGGYRDYEFAPVSGSGYFIWGLLFHRVFGWFRRLTAFLQEQRRVHVTNIRRLTISSALLIIQTYYL